MEKFFRLYKWYQITQRITFFGFLYIIIVSLFSPSNQWKKNKKFHKIKVT